MCAESSLPHQGAQCLPCKHQGRQLEAADYFDARDDLEVQQQLCLLPIAGSFEGVCVMRMGDEEGMPTMLPA